MKKHLRVNLAGGLANQLNCYFAALYFARKYGYKSITLNSGTVNNIHPFPDSLLSILPKYVLLKDSKTIMIDLEYKPTNLRLHGFIRSLGPKFYSIFKILYGILDDTSYLQLPGNEYHYVCESQFKHVSLFGLRNIRLNGFFPSQKFYYDLEPHLKSVESILNFSKIQPANILPIGNINEDPYCVLHLRVGEYHSPGRYTFGVLDETYYLKAISRVQKEHPKMKIWVVSDYERLALTIYKTLLSQDVTLIGDSDNKSPLNTFEFIRNATVVICANSGFSYWAARLSSRMQKTFIPSKLHPTVAGQKFQPRDWIKIENNFL